MHFRTTFFLLVLSVLLGAFIAIVEWGTEDEHAPEAARLRLLEIEPENVVYWSCSRDNLYVECAYAQGQWMLRKPVLARADNIRLNRMVAVLAKLPRGEVVTGAQRETRALSLADYGLAKPFARIVLDDTRRRHTLSIGGLSPMKDAVYVQVDGKDEVIATTTNLLGIVPSTAAELRDTRMLSGTPAYVKGLTIKRFDGPLIEIAREDTEWIVRKPVTARADWLKVNNLLEQIFNLQVKRFVAENMPDPAIYGLSDDETFLQLNLWQDADKKGTKLYFSHRTDEQGDLIYAAYGETGAVFALPVKTVESLQTGLDTLRDSRLYFMTTPAIAWIRIEEGEKALQLQKNKDNEWQVTEPARWKADNQLVNDLINRLNTLHIQGTLSDTNLAALGLAPPYRIVRVADTAPAVGVSTQMIANALVPAAPAVKAADTRTGGRALCLSRPLPGKEYIYAKFADEDGIYRLSVAAGATLALDPIAYRDNVVLTLNPLSVTKIVLRKQDRTQAVTRVGMGPWLPATPSAGPVYPAAIAALLEQVTALRAVRFEQSEYGKLGVYGLENPAASITFSLSGDEGIQKTLLLGEPSEDLGVYAKVHGQETVFVLPAIAAERLLQDISR